MGDVMLIIGSHVSFNKDEQMIKSIKEALSYGSNAFMFYTGAPQNTLRVPLDFSLMVKAHDLLNENIDILEKDFNNYSAIFIGGGNTYKLLNELKQNNNVDKIKTYLQNGGIVFGGSAGAIIFGKNIDACLLDDGNKIGLEDTEGFNYLNDISLLCHLKKKNCKKNINYLKEYTLQNKLIYLPEDDVLYIHNDKVSLIGDSKYLFFSNGQEVIHTSSNLKKDIKGKKD